MEKPYCSLTRDELVIYISTSGDLRQCEIIEQERVIDRGRTCFKCFTVLLTAQTNNEMVMTEISQSDLMDDPQIECRRSSTSSAK